MTGPWPAPALPRPLVEELGREPGLLRIGLCLGAFTGAEVDDGCAQAARGAAELLETLGHHVEESWPAALYEPDLLGCATKLAAVQGAAALDEWSAALGRTLGEADVEPATWSAISAGRALSGTDVVRALERMQALSREVCTWWTGPDRDGFDLLLTPTTAEPGPELGAYKRGFKPGRGSAFHARVQRDRPARAVAAPRLARRRTAERRAARRRLRPRGRADTRRRTTRTGRAVGAPPPPARLTHRLLTRPPPTVVQ